MPAPHAHVFSEHSTPGVPDSLWFASDFLLGAGAVVFQRETDQVVLVSLTVAPENRRYFFLPKGRKDVGESLEQTALRETYEESGYRAQFLPLLIPTRAPAAPEQPRGLSTEPIYVATRCFGRKQPGTGGEYLTFWYVAYIEADAVCEEGTRMADEQDYETVLMAPADAVRTLEETGNRVEAQVVAMAWRLWEKTRAAERE